MEWRSEDIQRVFLCAVHDTVSDDHGDGWGGESDERGDHSNAGLVGEFYVEWSAGQCSGGSGVWERHHRDGV